MFKQITLKSPQKESIINFEKLIDSTQNIGESLHISIVECLVNCILTVDGDRISLEKEDIVLIKSASQLILSGFEEPVTIRIFSEDISKSYSYNFAIMGSSPILHDLLATKQNEKPLYITFRHLSKSNTRHYCDLLEIFNSDQLQNDVTINFEKQTIFGLLFSELIRNYQQTVALTTSQFPTKKFKHASNETIAGAIFQYIVANIRDISLERTAAYFGYSPNYFSRLCKKIFKATFSQKVNEVRIELAKQMLCLSPNSIAEIAYDIGYENVTSFYKIFKDSEGMTPKDFRDKFLADNHLKEILKK